MIPRILPWNLWRRRKPFLLLSFTLIIGLAVQISDCEEEDGRRGLRPSLNSAGRRGPLLLRRRPASNPNHGEDLNSPPHYGREEEEEEGPPPPRHGYDPQQQEAQAVGAFSEERGGEDNVGFMRGPPEGFPTFEDIQSYIEGNTAGSPSSLRDDNQRFHSDNSNYDDAPSQQKYSSTFRDEERPSSTPSWNGGQGYFQDDAPPKPSSTSGQREAEEDDRRKPPPFFFSQSRPPTRPHPSSSPPRRRRPRPQKNSSQSPHQPSQSTKERRREEEEGETLPPPPAFFRRPHHPRHDDDDEDDEGRPEADDEEDGHALRVSGDDERRDYNRGERSFKPRHPFYPNPNPPLRHNPPPYAHRRPYDESEEDYGRPHYNPYHHHHQHEESDRDKQSTHEDEEYDGPLGAGPYAFGPQQRPPPPPYAQRPSFAHGPPQRQQFEEDHSHPQLPSRVEEEDERGDLGPPPPHHQSTASSPPSEPNEIISHGKRPIVLKVSGMKTNFLSPDSLQNPPSIFYAPSPDIQLRQQQHRQPHRSMRKGEGGDHDDDDNDDHHSHINHIPPPPSTPQSRSAESQGHPEAAPAPTNDEEQHVVIRHRSRQEGEEVVRRRRRRSADWKPPSYILFDTYKPNSRERLSEDPLRHERKNSSSESSAFHQDSTSDEQRFFPSFPAPYLGGLGPFGGGLNALASPAAPLFPGPSANRPPSRYHPSPFKFSSVPNRGPSSAASHSDRFHENNLLGSGNFEVVRGGTYYADEDDSYGHHHHPGGGFSSHDDDDDGGFYPQNGHSSPYRPNNSGGGGGGGDFFANFRDFADINPHSRSYSHQHPSRVRSSAPSPSTRPKSSTQINNIFDKLELNDDDSESLHTASSGDSQRPQFSLEYDPMMATY